jgi:hypothetical protein
MILQRSHAPRARQRPSSSVSDRIERLKAVVPAIVTADEIEEPDRRCRQCGGGRLAESELASNPGWSRWKCIGCKSEAADIAKSPDRTREWALAFRLGFGRYEGRTLGELARGSSGRGYLSWIIRESDAAVLVVQAAVLALGDHPIEGVDPCPRCGTTRVEVVRRDAGIDLAHVGCVECGRIHRHLAWPRGRRGR